MTGTRRGRCGNREGQGLRGRTRVRSGPTKEGGATTWARAGAHDHPGRLPPPCDALRRERCSCPYVVVWRHRGQQDKQTFRTLAEAREAKGIATPATGGRSPASALGTTSRSGSSRTPGGRRGILGDDPGRLPTRDRGLRAAEVGEWNLGGRAHRRARPLRRQRECGRRRRRSRASRRPLGDVRDRDRGRPGALEPSAGGPGPAAASAERDERTEAKALTRAELASSRGGRR